MRFLLLNQFYPPDPAPTGQYLHDLAQVLVARGHEVQVLCSRRSYDGTSVTLPPPSVTGREPGGPNGERFPRTERSRLESQNPEHLLSRPAATLSSIPNGGEGRGEEALQFRERAGVRGARENNTRKHPPQFPRHETLDGVEIRRLWATGFGRRGFLGKLADYGSFYSSLLLALFLTRKSPDLILSLTTPPYLGLLGKLAAKRHGCRHADWVMDLYPDVMFAHGMARKDGFLFRGLEKLSRFQLRGAQPVIALGPTMAQRVSNYANHVRCPSPVTWLPLWSDGDLSPWPARQPNPLRTERGWTPDEPVFLYSGNMGLGHRFTEFLTAAQSLGATGPRWVFCGSGKRRAQIEAFAHANSTARIELLEYAPKARLREHLCAAEVHLMSLDSAWQGFMVPSKLQASFAVGRPVLYVGGRNCETATWIQESGGGWVVDQNDLPGLHAAIQQALDPAERERRGRAAREFALQRFSRASTCNQLALMMEENKS